MNKELVYETCCAVVDRIKAGVWRDGVIVAGVCLAILVIARGASAQQPTTGATPPAVAASASTAAPSAVDDDDDAVLNPAEPDFIVVNLPTTKRLPLYKGNFRLTHRFAGNLRNGTFGEQASNLFGLDQGAVIGFEYRMAVVRHVQAAAYRSSFDKTIQFYGKYDGLRQHGSMPLAVSGLASVEGTNNFQEKYAPALGAVVSRTIATRFAAYATPMWIHNSDASLNAIGHEHGGTASAEGESDEHHGHHSTTYLGLGGRIRVLSTMYLVGEITPRLSGYAPNDAEYGFGLEGRVGGHVFSLTFTNTFGTTFGQLARGGTADTLYLGFNLGRKFY